MTKADDPFAGQLSLPPEFLPTYAQPYVPPAARRRRQQHAQFPMWWWDRLLEADRHTWALAIHILYKYWKNKNKPFKLANMVLAGAGIDRFAKSRALTYLERRGLVRVDRTRRKSPVVQPILILDSAIG